MTASPPANTPGFDVAPVRSSATIRLRGVTSSPGVVFAISGLVFEPAATTSMSMSMTNSLPSTAVGRRRPLASGSPSSMRTHSTPDTQPFSSPRMRVGFVSSWKRMPSCSAWCTSSARAGISSRPRRYTTVTSAPRRLAVRAASMATLPPPTTTHFLPAYTGVSYSGNRYAFIRFTRVSSSLATDTPLRPSPSMPR